MNVYLIFVAIILTFFAFGSIIGSFLNVVALRGLSGESIVLPPSKCPKCDNKLKPWHNIPILSYLFLRGKCAFCKEPISIQYPIVEAITGLIAIAIFFKYQLMITGLFAFILLCILLVMSVTDLREKVICTSHAWALILIGLIHNGYRTFYLIDKLGEKINIDFPFIWSLPITQSIVAAITGAAIMELLASFGHLFVKRRAFGLGDTFIAAGLGAFFGFKGLLISLAFSIAIQVGLFIPKFFKKLSNQKDYQTIIALTLFIFVAAGVSYVTHYVYTEEYVQFIMLAILAVIGVWACIRVIMGLKKEGNEGITILPFGPAMAIAAAITMFFF